MDGPQCVAGRVLMPAVGLGHNAGLGGVDGVGKLDSDQLSHLNQHNNLSDSDESVRMYIRQSSPDSLCDKESLDSPITDSSEEDYDEPNLSDYTREASQDETLNLLTTKRKKDALRRPSCANLLPVELTDMIASYLTEPQDLLNTMRVNSAWYSGAVRHLYFRPQLDCKNYYSFVESMSKKSSMAHWVRELDLSNIMQSGKNSYTSRLLNKCRHRLEVFIAPQTSFGYAPLVSIKQCKRLRVLDLSLVSEKVDLRQLFQAIENARLLERLEFPRSSMLCENFEDIQWPRKLRHLGLAGGINDDFIRNLQVPNTITHLSLSYCPTVGEDSLYHLFAKLGAHLRSLSVAYPMPALHEKSLDRILGLCPNLQTLKASIDYISRDLFCYSKMGYPGNHPLKNLYLDSSGSLGQGTKMGADDIALAALENKVPQLKRVRVTRKLGWNPTSEDVCDLASVLEDRDGGVWLF